MALKILNSNQCRTVIPHHTSQSICSHLGVDHVCNASLGRLASFGPDHHIDGSDRRAGPQQLLQEHLEPKSASGDVA